jgi:hypothetical protein
MLMAANERKRNESSNKCTGFVVAWDGGRSVLCRRLKFFLFNSEATGKAV